ncbi:MAG TPA: hypothetical protein PKY59_23025 [Pyrinomonadaceae bacterium]|nr:hypothetical protein [Pyrinomonadaceae bacterium]
MPEFISGMHNYCDRWCERCTFTARCAVAEAEAETSDEERDINNEAFWKSIAANFAAAKSMLEEKAAEFGIELTPPTAEEWSKYKNAEKDFIRDQPLTRSAETYWKESHKLLENTDDWLIFAPLDEAERAEMLAVVHWYQFFISAKIQRAFHGLIDFDGTYTDEELHDPQSDTNGSAKIALIAAARSQMAWTALLSNENEPHIQPLISLLETIKHQTENSFPNAQNFIRPGFDEINEIVM